MLSPFKAHVAPALWGVVCADIQGPDSCFHEVAKGPVPGLLQTIFGAEAHAAAAALRMGKRLGKPFWIWVDNQLVFNILKSCLVHQPPEVTAHEKDHDLNQLLVDLALSSLSRGGWQDVVKVTSHQGAWAFSGNEAADRCAVEGRSHFPEGTLGSFDGPQQSLQTITGRFTQALHSGRNKGSGLQERPQKTRGTTGGSRQSCSGRSDRSK